MSSGPSRYRTNQKEHYNLGTLATIQLRACIIVYFTDLTARPVLMLH